MRRTDFEGTFSSPLPASTTARTRGNPPGASAAPAARSPLAHSLHRRPEPIVRAETLFRRSLAEFDAAIAAAEALGRPRPEGDGA